MAARSTKKVFQSQYDVHPSVAYIRNIIDNMAEKTGRSLEQWIRLVKKEGPKDEEARRAWLKAEHGLGTNYAQWIAQRADGKGQEDGDPDAYLRQAEVYVADMFTGPKAGLKPLFDELLMLGRKLGKDVRVCPCKTVVPLFRNHVFAQLKPSTRTRMDLGLALGATRCTGRLIDTGGLAKKDRITHRIPITSLEEIDDEVHKWLRKAYEMDAGESPRTRI